ncbi:MAG TPA: GFA family protein [Steroidobacteraceae bacterium]|jgi:hypothetical protein
MPLTGGCLCKAVRYRIEAEPLVIRECWCRVCQYLGAGSSAVNACFLTAQVQVTGALTQYQSRADSGTLMHRSFCPACGTPVFSAAASRAHLLFVRVGTLDDPDAARPGVAIWTASAPRWACIDPKLPHEPGQPPPAA